MGGKKEKHDNNNKNISQFITTAIMLWLVGTATRLIQSPMMVVDDDDDAFSCFFCGLCYYQNHQYGRDDRERSAHAFL